MNVYDIYNRIDVIKKRIDDSLNTLNTPDEVFGQYRSGMSCIRRALEVIEKSLDGMDENMELNDEYISELDTHVDELEWGVVAYVGDLNNVDKD